MVRQLKTVNLQGKEYATVPERVMQFRADFPNSKIITKTTISNDMEGQEFNAYVWRDRKDYISGDLDSADSTGTAKGNLNKEKDCEKLETIAVGRALALLGYLASGEIASFEEMENYYADKESARKAYIQEQVDLFDTAKTMEQLKEYWSKTQKNEPEIVAAKDKRKAELEATKLVETKIKNGAKSVKEGKHPLHTSLPAKGKTNANK